MNVAAVLIYISSISPYYAMLIFSFIFDLLLVKLPYLTNLSDCENKSLR